MAEVNPKFPADDPGISGGPGGVQRARVELKSHRLFLRALAGGWNIPVDQKRKIVESMVRIVTHRNRPLRKNGKNPNPTLRERTAAARVLAAMAHQDTAVYLECLRELHLRERLGMEPDIYGVPTKVGQPVGPSARKAIEAEAEFSTPTKYVDENGNVFSKELDLETINEFMIQRYGKPIADLLLYGPAEPPH
jgi:hypothetical protein